MHGGGRGSRWVPDARLLTPSKRYRGTHKGHRGSIKREAASAMRLIHRYLLATVLMVAAGGAWAQTRDDRYSGVTGTIPRAAIASPAGGPAWSGEAGSARRPPLHA